MLRKEPPPRGSREAADNFCLIVRKHDEARGSREAADNFCLIVRKHDEARGSREAADNFCLIVRKHDEARGSHEVAEHFCRKSFCGKNCFQEIVTNRKSAKIILRSYTKVKYGLAQTILMR